jgi:hypothetical protein
MLQNPLLLQQVSQTLHYETEASFCDAPRVGVALPVVRLIDLLCIHWRGFKSIEVIAYDTRNILGLKRQCLNIGVDIEYVPLIS